MTRIVRIVAASIHGSALSISSHCANRAGPAPEMPRVVPADGGGSVAR